MKPHSLLSDSKLDVIRELAESARQLPGDAAEVGVYQGGSAHLIATTLPNKMVYLFDTFEGMPFQGELDQHKVGDFADTSIDSVLHNLQGLENVTLMPGVFPDDTAHLVALKTFCFVH